MSTYYYLTPIQPMSTTTSNSITTLPIHATTTHVILSISSTHNGHVLVSATSPLSAYLPVEIADLIVGALDIEPSVQNSQTCLVRINLKAEVLETTAKPSYKPELDETVDDATPPDALTTTLSRI
jgi:hypothetical protein